MYAFLFGVYPCLFFLFCVFCYFKFLRRNQASFCFYVRLFCFKKKQPNGVFQGGPAEFQRDARGFQLASPQILCRQGRTTYS